jgi:hypothetical protein
MGDDDDDDESQQDLEARNTPTRNLDGRSHGDRPELMIMTVQEPKGTNHDDGKLNNRGSRKQKQLKGNPSTRADNITSWQQGKWSSLVFITHLCGRTWHAGR